MAVAAEAGAGVGPVARITRITSTVPPQLSKTIERGPDGGIEKRGGGVMVEGVAQMREVPSLEAFAALLVRLGPADALAYGLPRRGDGPIVSRRRRSRLASSAEVCSRTREDFAWPAGPGIMMLDHDPADGAASLSRDAIAALVREVAPGLADAQALWWPSASSHIHDAETGADLTGLRGQRLYVMVADARDIPRAGGALVARFWAAGHGRIVASASGSALERCPIDAAVWQPERLDFAAGAVCGPGLVQRRGIPILMAGGTAIVDTRVSLPDDPDLVRRAAAARARARAETKEELAAARRAFAERHADESLGENERADPERRQAAFATAFRAVDHHVLAGDFPVQVEVEHGRFETVTVARLLDDPAVWHGRLTRDPLEPGYDGGRTKGKLYLLDARPTLHSFAHGGRVFRLVRAPRRIEIVQGRTAEAASTAIDRLRDDPVVFDFGGRIAIVEDGRMQPLDEHALAHHLGGLTQFWKRKPRGGDVAEVDVDPPAPLLRQILSLAPRRRLKRLDGVITAPILRPDGSVLSTPGYDAATRLLFDPLDAELPTIPERPSREQSLAALGALTAPFGAFPVVDAHARGALLAALLTAAVRAVLPTSPAFAIDAPVQGSGKTLLASCIAALGSGRAPETLPHTAGRDDEEVRKRLLSALLGGMPALLWDNVVGVFDSAALAAAITAPVYTDRVLGRSETVSVPNRMLILMTGNNLSLAGDLPRRVVICRIDPESETPFARHFDFDPLAHVVEHRMGMAGAALTLIRGRLSSDAPLAPGRMASFELWDDWVRQTVCWIGAALAPGDYGDPMDLVRAAQAADPQQESLAALLRCLDEIFGGRWFAARDVVARAAHAHGNAFAAEAEKALAECLVDLAGDRALHSSRSIGRVLRFRVGRIARGRRLVSREERSGQQYTVAVVASVSTADPGPGASRDTWGDWEAAE